MESPDSESPVEKSPIVTEGYQLSVDDGRDTFYALSIEDPDNDEAWLMSDTVCAAEAMR